MGLIIFMWEVVPKPEYKRRWRSIRPWYWIFHGLVQINLHIDFWAWIYLCQFVGKWDLWLVRPRKPQKRAPWLIARRKPLLARLGFSEALGFHKLGTKICTWFNEELGWSVSSFFEMTCALVLRGEANVLAAITELTK